MKKPILKFTLKGRCVWGDTKGRVCEVFDVTFLRKNSLSVSHNLAWDIYTDETFEEEITEYVKKKFPERKITKVCFSEQGLQKNYKANMDVIL